MTSNELKLIIVMATVAKPHTKEMLINNMLSNNLQNLFQNLASNELL